MHPKALFPISPPSSGSRFVHCLSAFSGQRRNLAHYISTNHAAAPTSSFSRPYLSTIYLRRKKGGEEEGNVPFFRRPYLCRRSPENRSPAKGPFRREGGREATCQKSFGASCPPPTDECFGLPPLPGPSISGGGKEEERPLEVLNGKEEGEGENTPP